MKRSMRAIAFLLVAVMLVAMLPLASFAALPVDGLSGKTIVALGDSLTQYTSPNGYTYVNYLSDNIGVDIINSGVGGDTTNHVMARFDEDVTAYDPDLVIFCIGMNDQAEVIATGEPLTALDTYIQNICYFVESIQANGGEVLFVTPNPVLEADGKYTPGDYGLNYNGGYLPIFCNAFRELAVKYNSDIVDLNLEFTKDNNALADLISDGIHQSDLGRQLFAYHIANYLDAKYDGENKATMTVNCVDEKGNLLDSYTLDGYAGANITLPSPEIEGYTTTDDIVTTFVDGAVHTYTYSVNLQEYLDEAKSVIASEYDPAVLEEIRRLGAIAEQMLADESTAIDNLHACASELKKQLALKGNNEKILSKGAYYTTTEPNRVDYDDLHCDDGKRLSDGIKGIANGGTDGYSAWDGSSVEILMELGTMVDFDLVRVYAASNKSWGIGKPKSVKAYIPQNGDFAEVAASVGIKTEYIGTEWVTYTITAVSDEIINSQYVKIVVEFEGDCVWIDEAEVALRTNLPQNVLYINKINETVTAGDSVVFTPAYGEILASTEAGNIAWTTNVIAEANDDGSYTVVSVSDGIGADTPSVVLQDNQILIAVHEWKDNVPASYNNRELARMLTEGSVIELAQVDVENATLGIAPAATTDVVIDNTVSEGDTFFVTHFNANDPEGAGVIFTEAYTGCNWWLNIAFSPVAGLEDVYEITAISNGLAAGNATPLAIPEGGFVYGLNSGNNWEDLCAGLTGTGTTWYDIPAYLNRPNYSGTAVNTALATARTWTVGNQFVISGLDLANKVVPTSTPYTDWFNADYVCTATVKVYGDNGPVVPSDPTPVYDNTFWVTHFNDAYSEGAGVIYTTTDIAGGWWLHVAFAPVEGTDAYEITQISNGVANGSGTALAIPEGGFVYAINRGNDWPAISGSGIDYTSPACNSALDIALTWTVGDQFVFTGLDLENLTVPTTTPTVDWYSDYYVCTATFEAYVPENDDSSDVVDEYEVGDVNADGSTDQLDYLLVKRAYFNTYSLGEEEAVRADVNYDNVVDQLDYVLLKRAYFGTYTIEQTK